MVRVVVRSVRVKRNARCVGMLMLKGAVICPRLRLAIIPLTVIVLVIAGAGQNSMMAVISVVFVLMPFIEKALCTAVRLMTAITGIDGLVCSSQ